MRVQETTVLASTEYFDNSYAVEREDRDRPDKKWGGGAIKNYIPYKRRYDWENESPFDNVWVEIKTKSAAQKLFINVVYIEPRAKFEQYQSHLDAITVIMCAHEQNAKFILLGDYNLADSIQWFFYDGECLPLSHEGNIATEVINTLEITELKQINFLRNVKQRILDLVLTNSNDISLCEIPENDELSKIDPLHPPFSLQFEAKDVKFMKSDKTSKLNFFKAQYELINYELSKINWNEEFAGLNIDQQVGVFYKLIESIIDRFTPVIAPKGEDYPKWFSMKLITLIKDKNYFLDKFRETNDENFNIVFKKRGGKLNMN